MDDAIARDAKIFVSGHRGLVGSAIVRRLRQSGFCNILTADRSALDLRDPASVNSWFATHRPDYVYVAAGTVGGILANSTRPAEFLYDNLMIHASVVEASRQAGVKRLLYLGSSCIYPRECPQPIREDFLLTGKLEETNEPYALAKITGIKLCDAYRTQYGCDFFSVMPTNLYGPGDNYDLDSSHVLPALIRKFHDAAIHGGGTVTVWGSGTPRRELLHVDDLADACVFLMEQFDGGGHVNVGTGEDVTIAQLAEFVRETVCPHAKLEFDQSKPDGTPRKLLDVTKLHHLGWRHRIELRDGIRETYKWFCQHHEAAVSNLRKAG